MTNKLMGIVFALLLVGSSVGLTGCMTTIEPGERGVKVAMGKTDENLLKEGFYTFNPFGERIEEFVVRQTTESLSTEIQTKDLQTIAVSASVNYKVLDSGVIPIFKNYAGDPWTALIKPRTLEAFKTASSKLTASEFIQSRDVVKVYVFNHVNHSLSGLAEISDFAINDIEFSSELTKAVEAKQRKQEEAKGSEYELIKAQNEAKAMVIKANAMKNNPSLVQMEFVKKWDGKLPEVMSESAYAKIKTGK
jgi:prohibitin 2